MSGEHRCGCTLNRVVCWMFHGEPTTGWWAFYLCVVVGQAWAISQLATLIGGTP